MDEEVCEEVTWARLKAMGRREVIGWMGVMRNGGTRIWQVGQRRIGETYER